MVSKYKKDDAKKYCEECGISSTSLKLFEWDEVEATSRARHLDFDYERHKILESELKMLYTAITRARVNVFIAEMDSSTCEPMFNYFQKRRLVDVVKNNNSKSLFGLRVFGQVNTMDEWRKRGEYYLQKAMGQKESIGCLRLAAKCFKNSGDTKKMNHALAYLGFVEMEEKEAKVVIKKRRHGHERKQRLYNIATQLLDAEDIDFLSKAGLCLMRTGPVEYARSAKIFEIYAHLHYVRRLGLPIKYEKPSPQEQQYFSYAAKLYQRCISNKDLGDNERYVFIVDAFRCYLSSGDEDDLDRASLLLENYSEHCKKIYLDLVSLWQGSNIKSSSPIKFLITFQQSGAYESVKRAMVKISRIVCRSFHAQNDEAGLAAAVAVIPRREERV